MEASTLLASGLHLFTEGKVRNTLTRTGPQVQGELLEGFCAVISNGNSTHRTWHRHVFQNYAGFGT